MQPHTSQHRDRRSRLRAGVIGTTALTAAASIGLAGSSRLTAAAAAPAGTPAASYSLLFDYNFPKGDAGGPYVRLNQPPVAQAETPSGQGTWVVAADGGVFTSGDAGYYGSLGGVHLNAPIVGIAPTPDGRGYWIVAADGGVFNFGDAPFEGSLGGTRLNAPIVGIAPTPGGSGYWLAAADGGVFNFGDAPFEGSLGGTHLNAPIVGIAPTRKAGYWLAAADGGVFDFGDAPFEGSLGGTHLNAPIVGIAPAPYGLGYWLAAADGGVFDFGAAEYYGSAVQSFGPLPNPIVAITASGPIGYSLLQSDPAVRSGDGYQLARAEWAGSVTVDAADQGTILIQAAAYLQTIDTEDQPADQAAIDELTFLAQLPEMDVTPAQSAEAEADVRALNSFFGTEGCCGP